jgi:hypothetical protein
MSGCAISLVDELWLAQDGCCFHCGTKMHRNGQSDDPLRVSREHLFPRSRYGFGRIKYDPVVSGVIVLAHGGCNSDRKAQEPSASEVIRARSIYAVLGRGAWGFPVRDAIGRLSDFWPQAGRNT